MPRYLALNPDDNLVFNCDSQDHTFKSLIKVRQGILDELNEPVEEDEDREYTLGESNNWTPKMYRIFKQVK